MTKKELEQLQRRQQMQQQKSGGQAAGQGSGATQGTGDQTGGQTQARALAAAIRAAQAAKTQNPGEYVGNQTMAQRQGVMPEDALRMGGGAPSQSAGADRSPLMGNQAGIEALIADSSVKPNSWQDPLDASGQEQGALAEPMEPAVPKIGQEQLREFDRVLHRYKTGKKNLEHRIIDNEQWWKLRHGEGVANTNLHDADKSAWLANVIMTKHADAMDAYPTCSVLPHEATDQTEAQKLSSIVPAILRRINFEKTYSDVWWQKLKGGTGCYQITWASKENSGLGEIGIRRVNLLNIFWEPGVEDIQDSAYFFHVELQNKELLKERYPDLITDDVLGGMKETISKFIYDDQVNTDDKALVIDCYYKRMGRLHLCKYVGSTVLYATENDPKLAQTGLYDHGQYPFKLDPLFPIEGSCCGYGYIDYGKSTQHYIDKLTGAIMKNALASARPRWFVRDDGGINEEEYADFDNAFIHVGGNMGKDSIVQIKPDPLPGVYLNVLDSRILELKETLGNRDASTGGVTASVTSAAGIASLQEAAGKLSRDAEKASYRVFEEVIYMVIELIRQFYNTPRTFRITGQTGQDEFVEYTNQGIQPQSQGNDFGQDQGQRVPQFDLDVQAQKENPYTKESYNELAVQLYQLGVFAPERANQALMMLDLMDFKGKQQLIPKIQQQNQFMQMVQQAAMIMQQAAARQAAAGPGAAQPGIEGQAPDAPQEGGSAPQAELTGAKSKDPADHASPRKAREQARAASAPR